jgi:hypothetical protein
VSGFCSKQAKCATAAIANLDKCEGTVCYSNFECAANLTCRNSTCLKKLPPADDSDFLDKIKEFYDNYIVPYWIWIAAIGSGVFLLLIIACAACWRCCCFKNCCRGKQSDLSDEEIEEEEEARHIVIKRRSAQKVKRDKSGKKKIGLDSDPDQPQN